MANASRSLLQDASKSRPLYLKLRDRIITRLLNGEIEGGGALPSVRTPSAQTGANPLTVAKAYQSLIETGIVTVKRGRGLYLSEDGAERLKQDEKAKFLKEEWPRIAAKIRQLDLEATQLMQPPLQATTGDASSSLETISAAR